MSEHAWVQDQLTSYLAGGLETADRLRLQDHLESCDECRGILDGLESLDRKLRGLFAEVQPPVTLEERTIRAVRGTTAAVRRRAWSWPMKGMMIAAAVMLLVGVGAILSQQELMFPGDRILAENNLRQMNAKDEPRSYAIEDPAWFESEGLEPLRSKYVDRNGRSAKPGMPATESGIAAVNQKHHNLAIRIDPSEESATLRAKIMDGSQLGLGDDSTWAMTLNRNLGAVQLYTGSPPGGIAPDGRAADMTPKSYAEKKDAPPLKLDSRAPTEFAPVAGPVPTKPGTGLLAPMPAIVNGSTTPSAEGPSGGGIAGVPGRGFGAGMGVGGGSVYGRSGAGSRAVEGEKDKKSNEYFFRPDDTLRSRKGGISDNKEAGDHLRDEIKDLSKGESKKLDDLAQGKGKEGKNQDGEVKAGDKKGDDKREQDKDSQKQPEAPKEGQPNRKDPEPATSPPQKTNATAVKKIIIRSGDIEFDVDSFDLAVSSIFRLIGKTKDGFVATVNSEKLANGKMRGIVVVRMPPEQLDEFVFALRQDFVKNAELKGQKIGSQDITKMYTDLESELKAARTMEERLLNLIRDGKGAIKDLLQVEKDLGQYRTKIEKLEGELRYYANLASLSTLTIILQEKEIRAAASYTETERVQTGIEVEEVEKAYQEAQAAIREFKGRISRAEMKQHAAGQFNAILVFEIAPESSGQMRDRLRQLGTMVRLEIDRVQKVDNGGQPTKDGKIHRGDSEFTVSLYNLANIEPRETNTLTLVAADVPATYRKLRDVIGKLKTQVRNAKLEEQDKTNVSAQLDFAVRRVDEVTLQQALDAAGEVLNRKVDRRAEGDNVTDAKVMFYVRLISTNAIEPRETIKRTIAVTDVPAAFNRLQEAITAKQVQGHVRAVNLQERPASTANVDFDVRRSEEDVVRKLLNEIGETLTRNVVYATGANVTDAKVLYQIILIPESTIDAREITHVTLAAVDVQSAYRKLLELAERLKGHVREKTLDLKDQQNSGHIDIVIARADEATVLTAIQEGGEELDRKLERRPEAERVTNSKVEFDIRIQSSTTIDPRQTIILKKIQVPNVPETLAKLKDKVVKANGRVPVGVSSSAQANGQVKGEAIFDVPLAFVDGLMAEIKASNRGGAPTEYVSEDPKAPSGRLAIARIKLDLETADLLVPRDEGFDAQFRTGLSWSLRGLLVSVSWLISAIVFIGPWALLVWFVVWVTIRLFRRPQLATEPAVETPAATEPTKPETHG
jgi:hypothetical protein